MKTTFMFLVLIQLINAIQAQENYYPDTAKFKNGEQIPFSFESRVNNPPTYAVNISPVCGDFVSNDFGMSIASLIRIKAMAMLESRVFLPYYRLKKENKNSIDFLTKPRFNFQFHSNIRFATRITDKQRSLILKTRANTEYHVRYMTEKRCNYYFSTGIEYHRNKERIEVMPITPDPIYSNIPLLTSTASSMIHVGITRDRYNYDVYKSSERKRTAKKYTRVRNYIYLTYAFKLKWDAYLLENNKYVETTVDHASPVVVNKIGWRFGSEVKLNTNEFLNGIFLGLEFGSLPALEIMNYNGNPTKTYNTYIQFHMGLELCTKK